MFRVIRENIRIHAEFEESLTALCCVVQGITENKGRNIYDVGRSN